MESRLHTLHHPRTAKTCGYCPAWQSCEKKSPVFLKEKVSCAFFSGVFTFNANWIYTLLLPMLTTILILYCDNLRLPSITRISSKYPHPLNTLCESNHYKSCFPLTANAPVDGSSI